MPSTWRDVVRGKRKRLSLRERALQSLQEWIQNDLHSFTGLTGIDAVNIFDSVRRWAIKHPELADEILG